MPAEQQQEKFAGWAILELMGHRRLGGYVSEAALADGAFLRIDVPGDSNGIADSTQFYCPGSVYCLTPTTEETVRLVASMARPAPVHQWELPQPTAVERESFHCVDCGTALEFENEGPLCRRCAREEVQNESDYDDE